MRVKLIAVYGLVTLIVGILTFFVCRAMLVDRLANPEQAQQEAGRAVMGANAQIQVQAMALERWAQKQALSPSCREPFVSGNLKAQQETAQQRASAIANQAKTTLSDMSIALVAFADTTGTSLGRDGSPLMRGDPMGKDHPGLMEVLKTNAGSTDLWINRAKGEQLLVAYEPVRDEKGSVIGVLVVGTAFDDGFMQRVSDATAGRPIGVVMAQGNTVDLFAKSSTVTPELVETIKGSFAGAITSAVDKLSPIQIGATATDIGSAVGLTGFPTGPKVALVSLAPISPIDSVNALLVGIPGISFLGIVTVLIASYLLGEYYSRPIVSLEQGLLAVINGETERRFEVSNPEFGGLATNLNMLLNKVFDINEDNTDDQGRPSNAPSVDNFRDALSVDADALRNEAPDAYYKRLYNEYIQAKISIGDKVDAITEPTFVSRIQSMEADSSARQGRPVRFRVERGEREVRLIAVPL